MHALMLPTRNEKCVEPWPILKGLKCVKNALFVGCPPHKNLFKERLSEIVLTRRVHVQGNIQQFSTSAFLSVSEGLNSPSQTLSHRTAIAR